MANTDKKGAGQAAGSSNEAARKGADQRPDAAKPSGDSPKPHGDPLLHVVKEKEDQPRARVPAGGRAAMTSPF